MTVYTLVIALIAIPWLLEAKTAWVNRRTLRRESALLDLEWELFHHG